MKKTLEKAGGGGEKGDSGTGEYPILLGKKRKRPAGERVVKREERIGVAGGKKEPTKMWLAGGV